MWNWQIPLFPPESVAVSVTVTVWLGVCVVVFFNLRFGWTLSGLVVPGFIVPLLLAKPLSATIIWVEAVTTYLLVRLLSDRGHRSGYWCSLFGRDRFFALVLVSILVRVGADGWLLPWLGQWLNETLRLEIDYRNDLHSYGLIVVALMANSFWKPGLARGSIILAVTVGLTYVLVRYGLIGLTNFNLGSVHSLYEDVSSSLLASPKAYIIIVTTAFLASWFNLRYSWDFNGILIPALLGLLWHEPLKVGLSVLESAWILVLATCILKLPVWGQTTMEGGRKLLLFFTIATVHRLALAHLMPRWSAAPATDYFGFGYLLTTFLAVKAHEKQIPLRLLRATVQLSMMGAVAGNLIGFAFTFVPDNWWVRRPPLIRQSTLEWTPSERLSLQDVLHREKIALYRTRLPESYQPPLPREIRQFSAAVQLLLQSNAADRADRLRQAEHHLATVGYTLRIVEQRYACLCELPPRHGWGWFVIDLDRPGGLLVEVPAPLDEAGTPDAALVLFQKLQGSSLAIAGTARRTNSDGTSDMLLQRNSLLATFHHLLNRRDTLQVRGLTPELLRATEGLREADAFRALDTATASLWICGALPPSLKLPVLQNLLDTVQMQWGKTPQRNVLRDASPRGYAELVLSPRDCRQLQIRATGLQVAAAEIIEGHLHEWLQQDKQHLAGAASEAYVPATLEEMLLFDREIVRPIVHLAARWSPGEQAEQNQRQQVQAIRTICSALDYDLLLLRDRGTGDDYLILVEVVPKQRHWGTFVFRCGLPSPYIVEVPRPLHERNAYEFGAALWERPAASALLIAGAHPHANRDTSSDVTRMSNKVSALNLVRQVLLREQSSRPMVVVQARAIRAPVGADVLVATDDGASDVAQLGPLVRNLVRQLRDDGLKIRLVDGSPETAGYEVGILFQAAALNHVPNKQVVSLWASPWVRRHFRDFAERTLAQAQFDALQIPTLQEELLAYLRELELPPSVEPCSELLQQQLRAYLENLDIVRLARIKQDWPSYTLVRLLDPATGQAFLIVFADPHRLPTVFNLGGSLDRHAIHVVPGLEPAPIQEFVRSRSFCLEVRAVP